MRSARPTDVPPNFITSHGLCSEDSALLLIISMSAGGRERDSGREREGAGERESEREKRVDVAEEQRWMIGHRPQGFKVKRESPTGTSRLTFTDVYTSITHSLHPRRDGTGRDHLAIEAVGETIRWQAWAWCTLACCCLWRRSASAPFRVSQPCINRPMCKHNVSARIFLAMG